MHPFTSDNQIYVAGENEGSCHVQAAKFYKYNNTTLADFTVDRYSQRFKIVSNQSGIKAASRAGFDFHYQQLGFSHHIYLVKFCLEHKLLTVWRKTLGRILQMTMNSPNFSHPNFII